VRRLREISELPPFVPESVVHLWQLTQDGVEPSIEEESRALAILDHPEFYALWEFAYQLPEKVAIAGVNPRLHVILHQVAETRLIQNDPPEAKEAIAHLISLGISRHRALHLLLEGVTTEIWTALNETKPADNERYVRHLQGLSRARVASSVIPFGRSPGRNDPCPCGSGKKYKKCCIEREAAPSVDLPHGRMVLPSPFAATVDYLQRTRDDDPLILLGNLSAVASYLEKERHEEAAAAAYRQLAATTEALSPEYLENALQDFQLFTLNHPSFAAEGITVTERLISRAEDPNMVATYRLDMADLYDLKGEEKVAERIFREVVDANPPDPYLHLRWARRLAEANNAAEAEKVYRRVIDRNGMGDPTALRDARRELAELQAEQGRAT
jgi:tetratricopeptide (TPR) repeat protein